MGTGRRGSSSQLKPIRACPGPHALEPVETGIPGLETAVACGGRVAVFAIVGEIPRDAHSATEEFLADSLRKGFRFLVGDLSRAAHVSSVGIGLMAYYRTALKERRGKLVLVMPQGALLRRLQNLRVLDWVDVYMTREAALKAVAAILDAERTGA